jgi:hypothetical protein
MEVTVPFKFEPREYQKPLFVAMDGGINRAFIVWHRRAGKDKACFNYTIKRALQRVGTYFYFLPEYSQAKKVIWDNIDNDGFRMLDHVPRAITSKTNDTELKITLVNGSIIQLFGADSFDKSGVGTNPVGVVFSEYPITRPDIWGYVRPILAVNGGWAIFNGTPRGQNHAFQMVEMARNNPEWFVQILTVDDTKVLTQQDIDREKAEGMPQDLIDQEYYCKFIENAANFFKQIDEVCRLAPRESEPQRFYQMGVDLAKYQDFTVISIIDLHTFEQVYMERFNQIDWNIQKAKIEAIYHRFNRPKGFIDATGVGDPIVEDLNKKGIMLEPFKFTEQSRRDLLNNLSIKMEQRDLALLNDEILRKELSYFQYEVSPQGKLKVKVPDSLHDDTVFATALSVWELPSQRMRTNRYAVTTVGGGVEPLYPEFGI